MKVNEKLLDTILEEYADTFETCYNCPIYTECEGTRCRTPQEAADRIKKWIKE